MKNDSAITPLRSGLYALLPLIGVLFLAAGCGLNVHFPEKNTNANSRKETGEKSGEESQSTQPSPNPRWSMNPKQQHTFARAGDDLDPFPGPDGKWLYFVSNRNNRNFDLYRTRINRKSGLQRLTSTERDERLPAVHPKNPNTIALTTNVNNRWNIWLFQEGSENSWKQITSSRTPEAWPQWSPDGSKIAYARFHKSEKRWYTWIFDVKTERHEKVGPGFWPNWHPKKPRSLLVVNARRRDPKLFFLELFEGIERNRIQLYQSADHAALSPSWSPDGRFIVFVSVPGTSFRKKKGFKGPRDSNLWMLDRETGDVTQLTRTPNRQWFTRWRNDRIYFLSDPNGPTNIFSIEAPNASQNQTNDSSPENLNSSNESSVEDY